MVARLIVSFAVVAATLGSQDLHAAAAALASPDPAARTKAACDVRQLGSEAAPLVSQLAALLADGSPVDPAVCGDHTWRARGGTDQTTPGEQAASALVAIGTPAYDTLARALVGPAWIARSNAAWALGALHNRAAAPLLEHALRDSEAAVRTHSAWALGALDAGDAVPALIDALKDSDAGVREQVAWALGAIHDRRAVDGLVAALRDSAAGVRAQAAWALGAIHDRRAIDALTTSLKDADARVRRQAAWALGAIGE
ncbi:MAG TPA: HEAT repeat domain-containing protein [Vicinamibacterales bacterium]|jgi:HEAT repeat protein